MSRSPEKPTDPAHDAASGLDEHVRRAVTRWPQIDEDVEGIVTRIDLVDRYLQQAAVTSLGRVGLTYEEFKVLALLSDGQRSHGSLCRELLVSTGAMTNRLDKLERAGLVERARDPSDRRGVLLGLTDAGRAKLDDYIELGAGRERELLGSLAGDERLELNRLLRKLLVSLQAELGRAPRKRAPAPTG